MNKAVNIVVITILIVIVVISLIDLYSVFNFPEKYRFGTEVFDWKYKSKDIYVTSGIVTIIVSIIGIILVNRFKTLLISVLSLIGVLIALFF